RATLRPAWDRTWASVGRASSAGAAAWRRPFFFARASWLRPWRARRRSGRAAPPLSFFWGPGWRGLVSGAAGGPPPAFASSFSTTFAVGSSTGLASAIFSTRGFAVSAFGASLLPAVILEKSDAVTRSTGRPSVDDTGSDVAESDHTLHSNTAACPIADMV